MDCSLDKKSEDKKVILRKSLASYSFKSHYTTLHYHPPFLFFFGWGGVGLVEKVGMNYAYRLKRSVDGDKEVSPL